MVHKRKKFTHEIEYIIRPYGVKSNMLKRETQFATSKKDADEWVKVLKKDPLTVNIVGIRKLEKGF